jgi:hypothetical protein
LIDQPDQSLFHFQTFHLDPLWVGSPFEGLIDKAKINDDLAGWMSQYPAIKNWVDTCIACHLENRILHPQQYTVPSNFADTIGAKKITIEIFNRIGRYDQQIKTEVHVLV